MRSSSDLDRSAAAVLRNLPNGSVSIFDRELRYVYAAGRGLDDVGLTESQLIGKTLWEVFPTGAVDMVSPGYAEAFEGRTVVFTLSFFHRVYSVSAAPHARSDGKVTEILVVTQDITVLLPQEGRTAAGRPGAALQTEIEKYQRLLDLLGHELRNPLTAIQGALAVIRRSSERSVRDHARTVAERQVDIMRGLAEHLYDGAQAKRGVLPLRFERVEVAELVKATVEQLEHAAPDVGGRIEVLPLLGAVISADPARLQQVLGNLLRNGLRHSGPNGMVRVRTASGAQGLRLSVEDEGTGIAAEDLPHIFEPARRGHSGAPGSGLGLGLWLSQEIMALHGGSLTAASRGEGQGAVFTMHVPRARVLHDQRDAGPSA